MGVLGHMWVLRMIDRVTLSEWQEAINGRHS
jgi:hypothetical protein